jgi:small-conductance mechanosensitive channel
MSEAVAVTAPNVQSAAPGQPVDGAAKTPNQTNPTGAPQSGDVAKAAAEAMRKLKIKHKDGKEEEVDEGEVLKVYQERKQHQSEASRKLNEGLKLRKQAEEFVSMLKDEGKLRDVLKKLGHDPRKLSEKILGEHLEDELMDPKDKELKTLRQQLEAREAKEKAELDRVQNERKEQLKQKFMKEYESDFVKSLESQKLPPTKEVVAKMAGYVSQFAKQNIKITTDEAASLVKQDIENFTKSVVGNSDGELLLKLLGEDVANKIRKFDTSKIRSPEAMLQTPQGQVHDRQRKPQERMSARDWQLHKRGLK